MRHTTLLVSIACLFFFVACGQGEKAEKATEMVKEGAEKATEAAKEGAQEVAEEARKKME
jgi:hypothetical protein